MKNRITPLEWWSWTILVLALVLFGTAMVYAGDPGKKSGKATIRIRKEENGKVTKMDTVISLHDEEGVRSVLRQLGHADDFDLNLELPDGDGSASTFRMRVYDEGLSADERMALRDEMRERLQEAGSKLKEAQEKCNTFRLEIRGEDDTSEGTAAFDWYFPGDFDLDFPFVHAPASRQEARTIDSLSANGRVVVVTEGDEEPPVLEKTVTLENGRKAYVFKRQPSEKARESELAAEKLGVRDLEVFPNPADEQLTVSFRQEITGDIGIRLLAMDGKTLYDESLRQFSGAYYKRIDVSSFSTGTYTLQIGKGEQWVTRKVVIR